jgi:LacI family transcriptional regulator
MADKMGYRPDPALSALVSYRHKQKDRPNRTTVTLVTDYPTLDGWRRHPTGKLFFQGIQSRARELGYDVSEICATAEMVAAGQLEKLLRAINCSTLIIPSVSRLGFDFGLLWSRYSVVTIGYSMVQPEFHRVSHHYRNGVGLLMEELRRRGFRRFAYTIHPLTDSRTRYGWTAGFLLERQLLRKDEEITLFLPEKSEDWKSEKMKHWLLESKCEVLVAPDLMLPWLLSLGYRVPEDLSFAQPRLPVSKERLRRHLW